MATKKGLHFWASLAGLFLLASELLKTSSSLSIAGVATSFLLHNPITALLLMFIFPIVTGFLLFTKQEAAET